MPVFTSKHQTTPSTSFREKTPIVLAYLLSWVIFGAILVVGVPLSAGQFFSRYSIWLCAILLAAFYAGFSLPDRWRWFFFYSLMMALFALPLAYRWTSGYSDAAMIGGLLPYKDSYNYYNGAGLMLTGKLLPAFSAQAAWRPLFPGFLASTLTLVGGNLKWALALLAGLLGFCCSLSAEMVFRQLGKWPAVLYTLLLYLYTQTMVGYPETEPLGLAMGCLGFILIWKSTKTQPLAYPLYGLVVLMAALSIRAGAFFLFPLLVIWLGWRFRADRHFSWRAAAAGGLIVLFAFLFFNWLYPRLVTEPGSATNGNFAFTIYGQVLGGASWQQAITDLGTTDAAVVYRAAWDEFLRHPHSLLIAAAKSYRDFFLPNSSGIFSFVSVGGRTLLDILLWTAGLAALAWGSIRALRTIRSPLPALLLAAWIGIFLSIPFLPPIDGGKRFHASAIPFFFALTAFAIAKTQKESQEPETGDEGILPHTALGLSAGLLILTVVVPLGLQNLSGTQLLETPTCPAGQTAFALQINPGAYIDLISEEGADCGYAPQICLDDFLANGTEKEIDDFYQQLVTLNEEMEGSMRLLPANDLLDDRFHFFTGSPGLLGGENLPQTVIGCAQEIKTQFQSIYLIKTIETNVE